MTTREKCDRWADLGLAKPERYGAPASTDTADLLAFGLMSGEDDDPIVGMLRTIEDEARTLAAGLDAEDLGFHGFAGTALAISRRVRVARFLLAKANGEHVNIIHEREGDR